jgi:predicted transcriptional regulator of viral defense system
MVSVTDKQINSAKEVFRSSGGILRTCDALKKGIHRRTLYAMRDAGHLDRLERGLYRLADLPLLSEPDLVTVAHKIPQGVICLISALSFHELTTQIPHAVYVALKRGAEPPRLSYPPTRVFWFSGEAFTSGVEQHQIDGSVVQIYGTEKTLADCFKYRNKIGMDTALEALKRYFEKRNPQLKVLNEYARICRVEKIMRPYIESQL